MSYENPEAFVVPVAAVSGEAGGDVVSIPGRAAETLIALGGTLTSWFMVKLVLYTCFYGGCICVFARSWLLFGGFCYLLIIVECSAILALPGRGVVLRATCS